nr:glycosyltransferase family 2 protein [uncultured Albidiferax sp.]
MITSITVTYQPELATLQRQLNSLRGQVQHMLVIDNGSPELLLDGLRSLCQSFGASLHPLGSNTGIAHAQNIGIHAALALGAEMVLLLDQDSEAMPGMVPALHQALVDNPKAAAAGPSTFDERTGRSFFFLLNFDHGIWPKLWSPGARPLPRSVEVACLIASGTLIHARVLHQPAPMLANWFIDHIDSEWCFRMRAQGWTLLGVPGAQLSHKLGDKVTQIWFLRWRQVAHHSPLRDFYMFRNSILLTQKTYVTFRWKLYVLARLVLFTGFFLAFTPQRPLRLKMMVQGIFDGLRGRTGPRK